jgi:ASC-1-like (ASCH) protein
MDTRSKTLWIKREFLEEILDGRKTVEVRVGYRNIQELKPGTRLLLNNEYEIGIKEVRRYSTFSGMLEHEEAEKIVPGMTKEEILRVLRSLYPPFKEKLGVFAIELESPRNKPQG